MIQYAVAFAIKYILLIHYGIYILSIMLICKLYTKNKLYNVYKLIFNSSKYKKFMQTQLVNSNNS